MNHLPTGTLFIALVPLAVAFMERRNGRPRPRLERIALAASLGLFLLAAATFPGQIVQVGALFGVMAPWGAAVLALGAFFEALPSLVRRLLGTIRRGRRLPHARRSPRRRVIRLTR